jgi:hypothetical protein
MAQILQGQPNVGQRLSQSIGALADRKIQQIEQRYAQQEKAKAYEALKLAPDQARALAALPDKLQQLILPAYLERLGTQSGEQDSSQEAPLEQLLQQAGQASPQAIQQNMPGLPQQFQVNPLENVLQSLMAQRQPQQQQQAAQQAALGSQVQPIQQQQPQVQAAPIIQQQEVAKATKRPSIAEVLSKPKPGENKQQVAIDNSNANWLKAQSKAFDTAQQSVDILDQMEQLLDTGKVASGVKGKYLPLVAQSDETQLFDKMSNTLAGLLSQQYGQPTGMKIKFSQSQKPNIEQNSGTQRELIRRLRKDAEKIIKGKEITDQLIAQNDYKQPAGLETKVNQALKQLNPANEKQGRQSVPDLYKQFNPSKYTGKRVVDEETGIQYRSNGKDWIQE